VIVVVSEYPR
jgi:hypothetical protein